MTCGCGKPKRKAKTSHQSGGRRPPPHPPLQPTTRPYPLTSTTDNNPPHQLKSTTDAFIELYQLSWSPRNQQAVPAAPVALTSLVASPTLSF